MGFETVTASFAGGWPVQTSQEETKISVFSVNIGIQKIFTYNSLTVELRIPESVSPDYFWKRSSVRGKFGTNILYETLRVRFS